VYPVKRRRSLVVRLLWASIVAVCAGLAGLVVFVHLATTRIDTMNALIADDTGPSIVAIESINVHLSQLRALLREQLLRSGDLSLHEPRIVSQREDLSRSVERYFSLPIDAGEQDLMDDLTRHLARFDGVMKRIMAVTPSTPARVRDDLRTELDASATDLDEVLVRASDLNANLAYEAARELRSAGRLLLPTAVAIEIASTVAAVLAIAAAYRISAQVAALAEQRLLEQKNAELEAFSARVAHDLLSPLMSVGLALGIAEHHLGAGADEKLRATMARASNSLQHVRRMVSDLLDFARAAASPQPGAKTRVAPALHGLVDDLKELAAQTGVELRLEGASERSVSCAEGILTSMLSNLVQNAIRHASKAEPRRLVEVRAVDAGAEVRVEVADTGPGVRPEDAEAIFEPRVTRTDGGSGLGLGLATVKRLAEAHGGHVGVTSEPGRGALFWVSLPAEAA
jgi:signal transduction histidine kinase